MNRFKKTMALTAACVIAATAVNVGGVGVNSPKVTFGNIVAAAAEENRFVSANADGNAKTQDTKTIELTFQKDPGDLTGKISIHEAKATIDSIAKKGTSGDEAKVVILNISNIDVEDSEQITVKVENTDAFTFNPAQQAVTVYKALVPQTVTVKSASVENGVKDKVVLTFENDAVTAAPENSKGGFAINGLEGVTVENVEFSDKTVKLTLNRSLMANENFTVSYDPSKLKHADRIKMNQNVAAAFSAEVENKVEAEPNKTKAVEKVEALNGEKNLRTTTKIKVTFVEAVPGLTEKSFRFSGAEVVKATTSDGGKTYELEIAGIRGTEQKLLAKEPGYAFTGDKKLNVTIHVKTIGSPEDSTNASVRPGSSAPSAKEEVKKEEPKKEEAKKDEAKKDVMPAMATTSDKVSTKLVIGQKTYTATVNGQSVEKTMDVAPMVHMGRTVLPARMISELLGVDVKFDQASKTASFMYGEGNKVELTLGQKFMMVNGEKVALTADILNKDGRILLPVTDIQKAFAKLGLQATVTWDAATKSVMIEK